MSKAITKAVLESFMGESLKSYIDRMYRIVKGIAKLSDLKNNPLLHYCLSHVIKCMSKMARDSDIKGSKSGATRLLSFLVLSDTLENASVIFRYLCLIFNERDSKKANESYEKLFTVMKNDFYHDEDVKKIY